MQKVFLGVLGFVVAFSISIPSINAESEAERKTRLETDLQNVERQILTQQRLVEDKQTERQSLERDVAIIDGQIKQAQLGIQARSISIVQLSFQIDEKAEMLGILEEKQRKQKQSLADLVRKSASIDDFTLVEVMLSKRNFSDFFEDVATYQSLKESLNESLLILGSIKDDTFTQKYQLESKQEIEAKMKLAQEQEKKVIVKRENEKKEILTVTKGEEKAYQELLKSQQKIANELRSALFRLRGVDGGGIPFNDALSYAKQASAVTGVRAAFILGILRQESNLGVNIGQCLLVNSVNGDGKGKNTGTPFPEMIKPDRDVAPFISLMNRLGRDPYSTPISCSQPGGYGGGMGPTQFIPSTWVGYEGRIASAFGVSVGDPWNPQHAIMATALYLQDLGAGMGGYAAEREAAGRYYAGGGWETRGLGYASSVLGHAEAYQTDIDFLENR